MFISETFESFVLLFNTTDSFRTGQMIVFVIESFKSFSISWTALIYLRMKKVTFHEWVNWIIHSVDLFRRLDLFKQNKWLFFMSESYKSLTHSICSEELIHLWMELGLSLRTSHLNSFKNTESLTQLFAQNTKSFMIKTSDCLYEIESFTELICSNC